MGGGLGLTIHGPNDRYINDAKIAQALGQMLTRLGIKTKVETMPKSVYFRRALWILLLSSHTLKLLFWTVCLILGLKFS